MTTFEVATIGFTQTTARSFFERLSSAGVRTLVDVRLHNTSQLAGFAKSDDLAFFLQRIGNISYRHMPILAPEDRMLDDYKKGGKDWLTYESRFMRLMEERRIEERLRAEDLSGACLLCSEAKPHLCHRRLVIDYLNAKWGGTLRVRHL